MRWVQSLQRAVRTIVILVAACGWEIAPAADHSVQFTPWRPLFRGIALARGECQLSSDQWLRGVALRIDLREPSLTAHLTADNGERPRETDGETTTNFLKRNELSVAMNVHFFSPCCAAVDGQPKDLTSLAVSNGTVVSPWEARMPDVMLLYRDMSARITDGASADLEQVSIGLAGRCILRDGKATGDQTSRFATARHPRSAIGLCDERRHLFLLVIDGRQPPHSVGATLEETAEWLAALGAATGLNVDGGGSTTLVSTLPDGSVAVLNKPSGGNQRVVGSNLGFRALPLSRSNRDSDSDRE